MKVVIKMIYDDALFELEDQLLEVSKQISQSALLEDYVTSYIGLDEDQDVLKLIKTFEEQRDQFERIEAYGNYAPDFKEKRRNLRKAKRALDTNDRVADFKMNETSLQNLLDYVSLDIAKSISEDIKVDAGNPFFEFASRGCGGSCHVK